MRDKKLVRAEMREALATYRKCQSELAEIEADEMAAKFPDFDNSWSDDIKAMWFDDFRKIMFNKNN